MMQRVWSTYLVGSSGNGQDSIKSPDVRNSSPQSSRRGSIVSDGASLYSQATSTRPILTDMNFNNNSTINDYAGRFTAPSAATIINSISRDNFSLGSTTNLSLSVNYIPSKFSEFRNRKKEKLGDEPSLPKQGAGLQAFKTNEARMPQGKRRLRWNKFKWTLFFANSLLMIGSLGALVVCLLTWFDIWQHADVIRTGNLPELILSTTAAAVGILTSVIGWAGILLNNRSFLAWYTFLTWITFGFLVVPGYMTYKHRTFNLEGKVNAQWSSFDTSRRLRVQNQLNCCGYFSPYIEATISQTCYSRTILPGCKGPYLNFQHNLLGLWYEVVFLLVPGQIFVMVSGLLCSNHITYRFGKGMMPEAYRLNMNTMAVIMDNYANQLAEQYGADVANNVIKRTRSRSLFGTTTIASTLTHSEAHIPMESFGSKSNLPKNSQPTYGAF